MRGGRCKRRPGKCRPGCRCYREMDKIFLLDPKWPDELCPRCASYAVLEVHRIDTDEYIDRALGCGACTRSWRVRRSR